MQIDKMRFEGNAGQQVKANVNPINDDIMKKFFLSRTWYAIEDTQQWFTGSIHNLATWDGKSILWSGTPK